MIIYTQFTKTGFAIGYNQLKSEKKDRKQSFNL